MLSEREALYIRSSFHVAEGHTFRNHARYIAAGVAEAAANDCNKPVGVWLDSLGFIVSRMDRPVTREDATLVRVLEPSTNYGCF